jgi:biopolymer transport protein ExbB
MPAPSFWQASSIKDGANKLDKNGAYRQIVDDGMRAQDEHTKLTDPIEQHDWMLGSLARSQGAITSKLGSGLALLATVGSTAPFIGLFGTVVGIYRALIRIGASGQASIDAVAGPVGEALVMTALGLAVAVPAVMQYNWLMRRNKAIGEELGKFSNDLHGYMMSGGQVKPTVSSAAAARPATTGTHRHQSPDRWHRRTWRGYGHWRWHGCRHRQHHPADVRRSVDQQGLKLVGGRRPRRPTFQTSTSCRRR